jgi:hypothetical protein
LLVAIATAAAVFVSSVVAQSKTSELRSHFQNESDPVNRAKLMLMLGESEFQDIRKDVDAGQTDDALGLLKLYRDEVQVCELSLDARKINAEKHPGGFKQLQISLRENLRRLNEISAEMTADDQLPFLEVRKDLEDLNHHLVQELFPHQPEPAAPPAEDAHH